MDTDPIDLEALSRETGVSIEVLRTFAGISNPANAQMFGCEAALREFADTDKPNGLDILRRATTPMTDEQSAAFVREHYGIGRGNVSSDDLDAAVVADTLAALREVAAGQFLTDEVLEAALTKPLKP